MPGKKTTLSAILLWSLAAILPAGGTAADLKEHLDRANSHIQGHRHFQAVDALREATRLAGTQHPSLHMRLAILYYGLGLLPEAIAEGERAVQLAPASKWYKYDLGKFYFVNRQEEKAEREFIQLLRLDPGFTLGYYYLGELYYRQGKYDLAWLSLQRAHRLGHRGLHLQGRLTPLSSRPDEERTPADEARQLFRFIKVRSLDQAKEILQRIEQGALLENLELELAGTSGDGPVFGMMLLDELNSSLAETLRHSRPYGTPQIIRTGPDYRIMQKILPFDPESWLKSTPPGTVAQAPPTTTTLRTGGVEPERSPAQPGQEADAADRQEVLATVEQWKNSWQTQDLTAYLAAYSGSFTPAGGESLAGWREQRQKSLDRPKRIGITIDDAKVEMEDSTHARVLFTQRYESDTYRDVVRKELTLEKEAAGWRITAEQELATISR